MIGRDDFPSPSLSEEDFDPNPIVQFEEWFDHAHQSGIAQPSAMSLATVAGGQPSARIVLLKHYDDAGFVFYTSYGSQKGREIAQNPNVALCFVWLELHRQVRIAGTASRTAETESDAYFASRPRGAQIAARASDQSRLLASRAELESRVQQVESSFAGPVPRPESWGGFRVAPTAIEFWQGQSDRLHDRLRYRRQRSGWIIERLFP